MTVRAGLSCWISLAGLCGVLELELEVLPASRVLLQSFGTEAGNILCFGTEKHPHTVRSHVAGDGIHHM